MCSHELRKQAQAQGIPKEHLCRGIKPPVAPVWLQWFPSHTCSPFTSSRVTPVVVAFHAVTKYSGEAFCFGSHSASADQHGGESMAEERLYAGAAVA